MNIKIIQLDSMRAEDQGLPEALKEVAEEASEAMETTEVTEVVTEATMATEDHSRLKMMRAPMNDGVDTLVTDSYCIHPGHHK